MCAKGNPKFSCPTISSSSDDESLGLENDSREELFDSSLNTVNVSVNTELPMNSSYGSEEEEFDFLHFYEELSDYDFHRMMSVDDFTYSTAFSNEVFDNGEWCTYAGLETCNIMKSARHGKELLSKSIQSTTQGDSGIDNLTYLSGDDTRLGTDHTKADVYGSSNDMSGGKSISENQNESDSDLEDDFFSVPEETEIFSESDDGEYFSADESLEGTLDASFKSIPCTVVSYQDNLGLNDLDPSTVVRSSEVPDPSDMWEDVDLSSLCIFNELPLEPCDNEVMFSRPIGFVGSSTDAIDYAKDFLRRQSTLENLLSAKSPDDCDDANSIWSILTDKLLYCQSDTSDSVRHFSYDSLKADSAKQRFFNAALNNEPCLSNSYIDSCNMAELYRDQLYDTVPTPNKKKLNTAEATANSNEPTGKRVFPQYVEDRYQDLEINTSYKYNPETSICATYLWTENIGYPKDLVTATAYHTEGYKLWFKQGRFPIGIDGEATAHLLDDTIYHLTKKGVPFHWGELQQEAFEQIKKDLTEAPVLAMPNSEGHMVLVSDTSKIACGSALYQEQKGRYRLIAYFSKKLPLSAQRYSISELELTGIYANVLAFKHLLRNVHFTLYCDHSALVHIMNGKKEPPTLRLKKLIENLSDFKFDIKFLRGKDMFVSDFLSRHPDGEESCNDPIIPVAFLMKEIELPQHSPRFLDWLNTMLDSREMVAYKERVSKRFGHSHSLSY